MSQKMNFVGYCCYLQVRNGWLGIESDDYHLQSGTFKFRCFSCRFCLWSDPWMERGKKSVSGRLGGGAGQFATGRAVRDSDTRRIEKEIRELSLKVSKL